MQEENDPDKKPLPDENDTIVSDYDLGYEDGFEGHNVRSLTGSEVCKACYLNGYQEGIEDREEIQRRGSSNT